MTQSAPENSGVTLRHKVTFLNSVFLFAGSVAFCVGFYRWQASPLLGGLDFLFAAGNLALFVFLKLRREKIDLISTLTLLQGYLLFTILYFFAPYNVTRIALFFLLVASAVFLKEGFARLGWLLVTLLTILAGRLLPGIDTGYSNFDILCSLLYLMALFFICGNFALFKHRSTSEEREQAQADVTQSRQQLDSERKLFQTILDNAPIGIWMLSSEHKLKFVNKTFCNALGIPEERLLSAAHYSAVLPSPMSESCMTSDRASLEQAQPHLSTEWVPFVDGKTHLLEITKVRLQDDEGRVTGLIGLAADISDRKQAEERSRLTAKIFENTLEGILITDVAGNIIEVNDSFCKITGYDRAELLGKNPRVLHSGHHPRAFYEGMWQTISATGHWSGEIWNRNSHGDLYAEWLTISAIHDESGKATHYVGICSDITVLKQHERQLERIAHYDALTGIPNRTLLSDRMHQAIARTAREQNMLAVCYLDLDGFKPINDQLGHEAGDRVLIEIARRIQQTIRGGDTVARLGGDEFVILLLGLERGDECIHTLERLLASIAQTIEINGSEFSLSASIGVSIYPLDDEDSDTLLRHADQAMYLAKQSGKNRFHIYDPALDQRTRNQQKLFRSIQDGLHEGQFELYYQPKVALESQQLVGVEALIRWNHPELGLLPPGGFLPAIENSELDIALGEWVIATSLAQIADWHRNGLKISVSINISPYHLESPEFIERLKTLLAQHPDWVAHQLEIEVLETVALEDISKVSHIIESCKKFGIGFALDDFGTGYSSLSYLSSLPIDTLKIDQSFMRDLARGKRDHAIVLGIIALSKAFDLTTIAEGIETPEQFRTLLEMGCDTGQGYGIARPMPAHALPAWSQKYGMGNLLSHIANLKE